MADKAKLTIGVVVTLAELQNVTAAGSGTVWIGGGNGSGGLDNTGNTLLLDALPSWLGFGPLGAASSTGRSAW